MTTQPKPRNPIIPAPTTRRGKIFFALGLILWFLVLMLPCGLFWFASGNQLTLHHANIPEPVQHPLLQIGTVMNPRERGLNITTSYVTHQTDSAMCVQTNVSYLLWQSRSESPSTSFCDCYTRVDDLWHSTGSTSGACPLINPLR